MKQLHDSESKNVNRYVIYTVYHVDGSFGRLYLDKNLTKPLSAKDAAKMFATGLVVVNAEVDQASFSRLVTQCMYHEVQMSCQLTLSDGSFININNNAEG